MLEAKKLFSWSNVIAALSLEAFNGSVEPLHVLIHRVRPHSGQIEVSKILSAVLKGSDFINEQRTDVQDPYSFRCIPQVHGAAADALSHCEKMLLTEINSVTDNPLIFAEQDLILSGGNFHGQPLAQTMDYAAMALSELGNISERRIYQLISGARGLPPFLAKDAGLHSGFMIPQYTAAALVSENKLLASPASVDSIVSSNGQEDHVSMGAIAAIKLHRLLSNLQTILAIELFTAAQAVEFRKPRKNGPVLGKLLSDFRNEVPFLDTDQVMQPLLDKSRKFLNTFAPQP
jgi:histidine ammonia-lyase